jgi:transposase
MNITTLGIDLAKTVFQLHGVNSRGEVQFKKKLHRSELLQQIVHLPPCTIIMEACGGANYWSRQFKKYGHEVKLISPQYVKPFVKTNKNDHNDAEAIVEAGIRPSMNFVAPKLIEQQDIQSIHRIRERLITNRTATANQIRGLLTEYGIVISQGIWHIRKRIPEILEDAENELTMLMRELINDLYCDLCNLDDRIKKCDKHLKEIFNNNETCQKLAAIEGIGVICATALVAAVGEASVFKNGRQMSAWLGLVPKQNSSGGKTRLLGISKRGDWYLRKILVHGCRSSVYRAKNKEDRRSQWVDNVATRRGTNKACVALANKNVRIAWAIMSNETEYRKAV